MSGGRPAIARQSVCVLLGGPSAEHDVSLVSGRAIGHALAERGHAVSGWLIDLDGTWWQLPPAAMDRALPQVAYDAPAALGADGPHTAAAALERIRRSLPAPIVFPALHGPFGEDGTVQALLESAGLVYTGCRPAASAIGMDKTLFKRVAEGAGIPVVPWMSLRSSDFERDQAGALARLELFAAGQANRQLVVKPARQGSSVGVSIVHRPPEPPELEYAVADAFRYDDLLLAEAYVNGARELEAAVMGNAERDVVVFGPGEILPGHEFYDYDAKYRSDTSRTVARPELDRDLRERVRELARAAYLAIGAEGFARVDFLLARDGTLYLSEINTIPGFTPISLFPILCGTGGLDFGDACERIVGLALERARQRPARRLTRAELP
ncbi:MAG: D-alanine-D-alanine ligase [Chloroflexota bacterium]|nr:D-alanine-D-alanine ligase [Chloroflexota bacterium]